MGKNTVIVLSDGSMYKLTPKALNFIDELKQFFAMRGIQESEISRYLEELARRDRARTRE